MLYDKKWDVDAAGRVLLDAADYIEKHGWCQGKQRGPFGQVCALGAIVAITEPICKTLKNLNIYSVAVGRLNKHIKTKSIPHWNDVNTQTKENVIETMRTAALFKTQETTHAV